MQFQITFDALGYVHPGPPGEGLFTGENPFDAWDNYFKEIGVPEDQHNIAAAIEDPDQNRPRLFFQRVPEEKRTKNRIHLDLRAAPGLEGNERMNALEKEAQRLTELGATRVKHFEPEPPLSAGFIVMNDPEGNEFCLD